jgi:predicted phosphoribosyltransferase
MTDELFLFLDRDDAGRQLAAKLKKEPWVKATPCGSLLVLSIPRGGAVVGAAVARALGCAHDIIAAKKIGCPGHEELAIGAVAEDGTMILGPLAVTDYSTYIEILLNPLQLMLKQMIRKFRHGRSLDVAAKTVILVDDGIATGETMKAAIIWLRTREYTKKRAKIVVAVPVCSRQAARQFNKLPDEFICLAVPQLFWSVGQYYWDFDQVSDKNVLISLTQNTIKRLAA